MTEFEQGGENLQQIIPPLSLYESTQSKSVNLNQLIKIHRSRQRYEIIDRFFNNSYICIENKVQPIQVYYQNDRFKSYIEDLNMVYFKDIEFNQNVRLEYVMRRLNFTLNGENYSFKQFLKENKVYEYVSHLYSDEYLEDLDNTSNDKNVVSLRNQLFLIFLIHQLRTYNFTNHQCQAIITKISQIYQQIKTKIQSQHQTEQLQDELSLHRYQCPVNSLTNQSQKSHQRYEDEQNQSHLMNYLKEHLQNKNNNISSFEKYIPQSDRIHYFFDDLIYEEEIDLKIIQIELENFYFSNQMNNVNISEQHIFKLKYLSEINKEYIDKLKDLKKINSKSRHIFKKLQRNLKIQFSTGSKCIVLKNSNNFTEYFGHFQKNNFVEQQKQKLIQKLTDSQCLQKILIQIITKLKLRLIADAMEKVYQIHRQDSKNQKHNGNLTFQVSFERGMGIREATFNQKDFLLLNNLRQESTLTSYLTPMKSYYSYISHNIYTFLKICEKDFAYDKETNNNEEVLRRIKNKISRHRTLGKADMKQFYYDNFKICHNCKILCQKSFLKQCKRRVKHQRLKEVEDGSQVDDDSLYTERNNRNRKYSGQYVIQCEKNFCIYCIKNQFNGKIFNDKGWCPACLDSCHCNTCLRQKMVKRLVDLYAHVGGNLRNIKTEKELVENMRIKMEGDTNHYQLSDQQSLDFCELDEKVYEAVIKKQIMKGYSAGEIDTSLLHQQELIRMIIEREKLKLQNFIVEKSLFRKKINYSGTNFQSLDKSMEEQKHKFNRQGQNRLSTQRQETQQKLKRQRQEKSSSKPAARRKLRKKVRDQQIYYNYYYDIQESCSDSFSSSFHIKHRKYHQRKYEPSYDF